MIINVTMGLSTAPDSDKLGGVAASNYAQKTTVNGTVGVNAIAVSGKVISETNAANTIVVRDAGGNVSVNNLVCNDINGNNITGNSVFGAVWNDYAEFRQSKDDIAAGYVVVEDPNNDDYVTLSQERLNPTAMIVSDTFGFSIGKQQLENEYSLPIAVSGRVLAYTDTDRTEFKVGDVVCSGRNGTISKMTSDEISKYPHAIIGVVSSIPSYETWGTGNVQVDNRIWIKIK